MAFGESDTLNNNLPPNCITAGHNCSVRVLLVETRTICVVRSVGKMNKCAR